MLRYKTETRPGLVALYDIRPGNGAGPFLQPRSPHRAKQQEEEQEAQLMLTNLCDVSRGQSMSPNILPFHMLGRVSYCTILTLSLRRVVFFLIFDFKKCRDLKIRVRGHSRSLKVVLIDRLRTVSY